MSTATLITADEFARMSFDMPVELVRGEIVEMTVPGYRHGVVCLNVGFRIRLWTSSQSVKWIVATNDSGIVTQLDPDTVRGADVQAIRADRLGSDGVVRHYLRVAPELTVEVLSPSDRFSDVMAKVEEYLELGVQEVWIVDPESRSVRLCHPDGRFTTVRAGQTLSSVPLVGLSIPVDQLFESV